MNIYELSSIIHLFFECFNAKLFLVRLTTFHPKVYTHWDESKRKGYLVAFMTDTWNTNVVFCFMHLQFNGNFYIHKCVWSTMKELKSWTWAKHNHFERFEDHWSWKDFRSLESPFCVISLYFMTLLYTYCLCSSLNSFAIVGKVTTMTFRFVIMLKYADRRSAQFISLTSTHDFYAVCC